MDDETFIDMILRFLIFVNEINDGGGFAGAGRAI
jgi:hypothetical protein